MPCRSSLVFLAFAACRAQPGAAWPAAPDVDAFFRAVRAANLASAAPAEAVGHRAPRGVKVAPQWIADTLYSSVMIGMNFTDGDGQFAYDAIGQRYRNVAEARLDVFYPNGSQFIDQISKNVTGAPNQNMTVGQGPNGVCMPIHGAYFDIFSWTTDARYNGSKVINGESCAVWQKDKVLPSLMGGDQLTHFSACIAEDGVPREFTQAFTSVKVSGVMSYRFRNVRIGDPGDAIFASSAACATNYPGRPCQDEGVNSLSTYRIWAPPEPMELANRNAGDVMGDLAFLCTQAAGEAYRSKLITHWSVKVSSSFGQYALCNYDGRRNKCSGEPSMLRRVGRRASQMGGRTPAGGQCSSNADIGSQYSFPGEARCPEGTSPSAGGCAWADAEAVRTISVGCVLERGLLEACGREFGHAPFRHAVSIFEAAFASDDPSKGGCPDVGPSPRSAAATTIVV